MARDSTDPRVLSLLQRISEWRFDAEEAVISIGASQRTPKYCRAWHMSRPTVLDPDSNDGWQLRVSSSLPLCTASLARVLQESRSVSDKAKASFDFLRRVFEDWHDPAKHSSLPPAEEVEKHVKHCLRVLRELEQDAQAQLSGGRTETTTTDDLSDFASARWFTKNTDVPPERLRKAARRRTKHVRSRVVNGVTLYSKSDATKWWPNEMPPIWVKR